MCGYAVTGNSPPGQTTLAGDPLRAALTSLRRLPITRSCNANIDTRGFSVLRFGHSEQPNVVDLNLSGCVTALTPSSDKLTFARRYLHQVTSIAEQAWAHRAR
jgi:hypothetical protein